VYKNEKLKDVVTAYTIHGPFFFGAMSVFDKKINEHIEVKKPIIILRFKYVPFIDSTALVRLNDFILQRKKEKGIVLIADANPSVYRMLKNNKEFMSLVKEKYMFHKTKDALSYIEKNLHHILLNGK